MKKIMILTLAILPISIFAQQTLDDYVAIGVKENLALKQKDFDLSKSYAALKQSRSYFFPQLSLSARYTIADGGRLIEIPVGDMLNPVYYTLNQITTEMANIGLTNEVFPNISVENEQIPFLREKEQETKLALIQPVFNPEIYYNNKIKKEEYQLEKISREQYQRELVAEIHLAYFRYMQAVTLRQLYENTLGLLDENIRVSEKLFENDKVTMDVVYRSKAEKANINKELQHSIAMEKSAAAWFNFLLNRPIEDSIHHMSFNTVIPVLNELQYYQSAAMASRDELQSLVRMKYVAVYYKNMQKGNYLPRLTAVVNYGFQGEKYRFSADDDFVIASMVLQWDLFTGMKNKREVEMAAIQQDALELKNEEIEKMIQLQVYKAFQDVKSALSALESSEMAEKSSAKAFFMMEKKYAEGIASLIEYIDARTNYTSSQQMLIISRFALLEKMTELEKNACLIQNPNPNK